MRAHGTLPSLFAFACSRLRSSYTYERDDGARPVEKLKLSQYPRPGNVPGTAGDSGAGHRKTIFVFLPEGDWPSVTLAEGSRGGGARFTSRSHPSSNRKRASGFLHRSGPTTDRRWLRVHQGSRGFFFWFFVKCNCAMSASRFVQVSTNRNNNRLK